MFDLKYYKNYFKSKNLPLIHTLEPSILPGFWSGWVGTHTNFIRLNPNFIRLSHEKLQVSSICEAFMWVKYQIVI